MVHPTHHEHNDVADADPLNYEVDTGSLSLTGIAVDDPVISRGFPTPFGTAPSDFTAVLIISN